MVSSKPNKESQQNDRKRNAEAKRRLTATTSEYDKNSTESVHLFSKVKYGNVNMCIVFIWLAACLLELGSERILFCGNVIRDRCLCSVANGNKLHINL